jgi:GH24 family phage-related lysozyme (muramidase)
MQYAASYQLRCGVITVTYGSASRVIRVGEAVAAPESLARTILKKMVTENAHRAEKKPMDPRVLRGISQAWRSGSG